MKIHAFSIKIDVYILGIYIFTLKYCRFLLIFFIYREVNKKITSGNKY